MTERDIEKLAQFAATRFLNRQSPGWRRIHEEDVRQFASVEAWRYARNYDPTRGRLSTYLVNCVTGRLRNYLRDDLRNNPPAVSLDALLIDSPTERSGSFRDLLVDPHDLERETTERAEAEWCADRAVAIAESGSKSQCVLLMGLLSGWTGRDVARHLGTTDVAVSSLRKRAIARLRAALLETTP